MVKLVAELLIEGPVPVFSVGSFFSLSLGHSLDALVLSPEGKNGSGIGSLHS